MMVMDEDAVHEYDPNKRMGRVRATVNRGVDRFGRRRACRCADSTLYSFIRVVFVDGLFRNKRTYELSNGF